MLVIARFSFFCVFYILFCSCQNKVKGTRKGKHIDSSIHLITSAKFVNDTSNPAICVPGIYQDVSLGYDSINKTISGVYQYYDNWDEKYKEFLDVNVFYFFGLVDVNAAGKIKGSWPSTHQKLNGKFLFRRVKDSSSMININLDKQPDGYNDIDFTKSEGVSMYLDRAKKWIEVRIIKSPRAKLYSSPDSSTVRKGYLVSYDIVKVLSKNKTGWLNIEYNPKNDNTKSAFYWIREEDLYNSDPDSW